MSVLKVYTCSYPAILIPKIGNGEENKIRELKTAYEKMAKEIAELEPNTIIFVSPLAPTMSDKFYISSIGQADFSFKRLGHRELNLSCRYDDFFANQLKRAATKAGLDSFSLACYDSELDEATAVPLWYIQKRYKDFNIVRVGLSMLSFKKHEDLGKQISKIADFVGKRVVVVALGQLANHRIDKEHNKSLPEAARFDAEICRIFKFAELSKLKYLDPKFCLTASATDIRSFIVAAGVLSAYEYQPSGLEYTASFGHGNVFSSFNVEKVQFKAFVNEREKLGDKEIFNEKIEDSESSPRNLEKRENNLPKAKIHFDKSSLKNGEKLEDFNKSYVNEDIVDDEAKTKAEVNIEDKPDVKADVKNEDKSEVNNEMNLDYSPHAYSLVKSSDSRSNYEKKLFNRKLEAENIASENKTDVANEDGKNLAMDSMKKSEFDSKIEQEKNVTENNKNKNDVKEKFELESKSEPKSELKSELKSEPHRDEASLENTNTDSRKEEIDKSKKISNKRKVMNVYKLPLKSDPYVELAIFAIRYFVQYGKMAPLPNNIPEKILNRKSACFISVYLHEQLMGCIGTLDPKHNNLAEEIVYNAVAACKNDQRFRLKSMTDARQLRATVDVLGETEPVYSLGQLDPSQYGIVVYKGERKALLLPRLAGVNTIEQQLGIAATKAGVDVRKIERVDRFAVERHI